MAPVSSRCLKRGSATVSASQFRAPEAYARTKHFRLWWECYSIYAFILFKEIFISEWPCLISNQWAHYGPNTTTILGWDHGALRSRRAWVSGHRTPKKLPWAQHRVFPHHSPAALKQAKSHPTFLLTWDFMQKQLLVVLFSRAHHCDLETQPSDCKLADNHHIGTETRLRIPRNGHTTIVGKAVTWELNGFITLPIFIFKSITIWPVF